MVHAHPRPEKEPAGSSSWKGALSLRPDAVHPRCKVARSEICNPVRFFSGITTIALTVYHPRLCRGICARVPGAHR